ncbi:MAG: antitoxin VapB family protein [Opitutales bacterium]|jgi:predicted CopG family antitoxin
MPTKTISLETDAYRLLKRQKRGGRDSFSQVVRRLVAERPAATLGELDAMMEKLEGAGAGPRRRPHVTA